MQNCPVCHATDNNPQFCGICEYDPKAEFEKETAMLAELKAEQDEQNGINEEFLDLCDKTARIEEEERLENGIIAGITAANPGATQCPMCHNTTFVGGVCMYCFFDEDDFDAYYDFDMESERDPLNLNLPRCDV